MREGERERVLFHYDCKDLLYCNITLINVRIAESMPRILRRICLNDAINSYSVVSITSKFPVFLNNKILIQEDYCK